MPKWIIPFGGLECNFCLFCYFMPSTFFRSMPVLWKFPKPSQLCYLLSTASPLLEWICMGRHGDGGVWRWSCLWLLLHQHLHTLTMEFYRLSGMSSSHSCLWSIRAGSIYAALNNFSHVALNKYFLSPKHRASELNTDYREFKSFWCSLNANS